MRILNPAIYRLGLPLIAAIVACIFFILDPVPLQTLRNAIFDHYQRWHPRAYHDAGVRIVDLDDESLNRLGQWPWSRAQVATLVTQLKAAGADSIAFDVLFAEPDRTSPSAMLRDWNLSSSAAAQIAALPDPDIQLAAALRDNKIVLGIAEAQQVSALPERHFGLVVKGSPAEQWLPKLSGTVSALPQLASAAAGSGAITFIPNTDGIVRVVPMMVNANGELVLSLVSELLRVSEGARNVIIHSESTGITQFDIGKLRVPTAADGQFWIHFTRTAPGRTISAWQVMANALPKDSLRGSLVVVGTSAQGLQDLRFSPLGGVIPGVEIHAQALEQIRTGHWLQRPQWASALEASVMLGGSLALCLFAWRARAIVSAIGALLFLLGLNWAGWIAFREHLLLLDAVMPSIGIAITYVLASVARHMATEAKQRWIQQAFARYVSPNRVAYLMSNPDALELGGRRQQCSFIFTDLTDFTGLVETNTPEAVVAYLNGYLDGLIEIAFRHEGTLDRIVGDAVAIMFSAPVPQPDHPARALKCALEMRRYAQQHAAVLREKGIAFGSTRIGVHCGEVVVGNFGGGTIFDYRAMGDAVNVAARLETLNQHLGTTMCVSGAIHEACMDVPMRAVGQVLLKGKALTIAVYEPLIDGDSNQDSKYNSAYALLNAEDNSALEAFARLSAMRPQDALVAFHLQRLQSGERGELIVMAAK
jgi:adenylate cyclase